ncbi:MAG: hypothetical protein J2P45_14640 [Candidatus Dormibacteraeota bacterium]|nr:hypothetical protein [Candidatus Dormibacteraeota bacterium]
MVDRTYTRLLRDRDLELLAQAAGQPLEGGPQRLRGDPQLVESLLRLPAAFEALFRAPDAEEVLLASPFLVFAVLVNRVAADLEGAAFVEEWQAPNRTLPVFDVESLRGFLAPARHRTLLAELLASFTKVASGTWWERTSRGWRRHRYSELDPVRLAELLEVVPAAERAAVYRRLGDVALFLSGVFPDHTANHPLPPRHLHRIARLLGDESGPGEVSLAGGPQRGVWTLEWLGRRAYGLAVRSAAAPGAELRGLAEGFGSARRVLNLMTGRYLYPSRERWFPAGS